MPRYYKDAPNAKPMSGRLISAEGSLELPKGKVLSGEKPGKKVEVKEFRQEEHGDIPIMENKPFKRDIGPLLGKADQSLEILTKKRK